MPYDPSLAARGKRPHESEVHIRRRGRNIAVALILVGFCVLLFWVSIVKMGRNAGNPGIVPGDNPAVSTAVVPPQPLPAEGTQ